MKTPKIQVPSSKKAPSSNGPKSVPAVSYFSTPSNGSLLLNEKEDCPPFDLQERTAQFGEAIVKFSKKVPLHPSNTRLISQIVGAGTSVGANYCEANEPVSKKDFRHSISRCIKEVKETKFFLRMIVASEPQLADEARKLYREAKELLLIFSTMYRK